MSMVDIHEHNKVLGPLCKVSTDITFKARIRLSENEVKLAGESSKQVTMDIRNICKSGKNMVKTLWHHCGSHVRDETLNSVFGED